MKVKLFDEEHEINLENAINKFIDDGNDVIDIKYSVAIETYGEEQIYCYSALVMYEEN